MIMIRLKKRLKRRKRRRKNNTLPHTTIKKGTLISSLFYCDILPTHKKHLQQKKEANKGNPLLKIVIDRKNTLIFICGKDSFVQYIPTSEQKNYLNKFFERYEFMYIDEHGKEQYIPIVIYDNVRKITTKLYTEKLNFKDIYANVPKSVRYKPNKLMTFERDKQDWMLTRVKRKFNSYDNNNINEQEFKTEMRVLLNR